MYSMNYASIDSTSSLPEHWLEWLFSVVIAAVWVAFVAFLLLICTPIATCCEDVRCSNFVLLVFSQLEDTLDELDKYEVSDRSLVVYLSEVRYQSFSHMLHFVLWEWSLIPGKKEKIAGKLREFEGAQSRYFLIILVTYKISFKPTETRKKVVY